MSVQTSETATERFRIKSVDVSPRLSEYTRGQGMFWVKYRHILGLVLVIDTDKVHLILEKLFKTTTLLLIPSPVAVNIYKSNELYNHYII